MSLRDEGDRSDHHGTWGWAIQVKEEGSRRLRGEDLDVPGVHAWQLRLGSIVTHAAALSLQQFIYM